MVKLFPKGRFFCSIIIVKTAKIFKRDFKLFGPRSLGKFGILAKGAVVGGEMIQFKIFIDA